MNESENAILAEAIKAIAKAAIKMAETWNSSLSVDLTALSALESQTGKISRMMVARNTAPRKS